LVKEDVIELLESWKAYLFTITFENGKEFEVHQEIEKALKVDSSFANAYSTWEREANENLSGLIRQYIPKSKSYQEMTKERIIEIHEELNYRPTKRINFQTPNYMFNPKVLFVT
jgi:IS30 family transposase